MTVVSDVSSSRSSCVSATVARNTDFLLGIRGIIALETFLWTFFTIFAPNSVSPSTPPEDTTLLSRTLGVLFWDQDLIFAHTLFLSSRLVCAPFLSAPQRCSIAGSIFRRGIRLSIPLLTAFAVVYILQLRSDNFAFVQRYNQLADQQLQQPYRLPSPLSFFNAVFDVFWATQPQDIWSQAANRAFPVPVLWALSVIYGQSYTVYTAVLVVHYTRPAWRVKAALCFILAAWWVRSWSWYSVTGLLVADLSVQGSFENAGLQLQFPRTIWRRSSILILVWPAYALIAATGMTLRYVWIDIWPAGAVNEVFGHAATYAASRAEVLAAEKESPGPRVDVYLIALGIMLLVESTSWARKVLAWRGFVAVGRRSYSYFLVGPIVCYTAGVKIWVSLVEQRGLSGSASNGVVFLVCLLTTLVIAEAFYWLVDRASQKFARMVFDFVID